MKKSIYSDGYNIFIQLLTQARLESGLLQADLAKRLGKHQSFISKIENCERRVDIYEIYCICDAIGIQLSDLVIRYEQALVAK